MAAGDVTATLTKVRAFNGNTFDGVDDYVEIPHAAAQLGVNLTNGFTISAWVRPESLGETEGYILSKVAGTATDNGFRLSMSTGTLNAVGFRIVGGFFRVSAATVAYGVWKHVLVTIGSDATVTIRLNGVVSGTPGTTSALSNITATSPMCIGNRSSATDRSFDGSLRDVKMWNRVLSAAEIASDYAGTTPMTGLIHWFKLGGDYADYGSVGVTATNSGSVPALVDDALAAAVKAQRVASTDKWMVWRGSGGQVGTVNIE